MSGKTKAAVTVSEMARMLNLSRARFYQLISSGVFPPPAYDIHTKRTIYVRQQQEICLEVKQTNCAMDGRPVLFYSKVAEHPLAGKKKRNNKKQTNRHADLLAGLEGLGLTDATEQQVQSAIKALFPSGISEVDQGEMLRQVFLYLKRERYG